MFGMSLTEIMMVIVLALVVLGPEKLPKVAKMLGKGLREIRRATNDIRQSLEIDDIRSQLQDELSLSRKNATAAAIGWKAPDDPDDPYAQAARDDLDELDDAYVPSGPYGEDDEDDEDGIEDAEVYGVASQPNPTSTHAIEGAPDVTAVELESWHSLTGVGVLIQQHEISPTRLHTVPAVKSVPVQGGISIAIAHEKPSETEEQVSEEVPEPDVHQVSDTLTAVSVNDWSELTGVGVLIQRQTIPAAPVHLLGGVVAIPIRGALGQTPDDPSST